MTFQFRFGKPSPSLRKIAKEALKKQKKRGESQEKFGNHASLCMLGHSHRSKLESSVCQILQFRVAAGEIDILQIEDHVLLSGWYTYVPDFKCRDLKTGEIFWVEAKGFADNRWPSTKKGWRHAGPGKLEIWGGEHGRPLLLETIVPKNSPTRGAEDENSN